MIWLVWAAFWIWFGCLLGEAIVKMRTYPYRWTCPHCKTVGIPFRLAMNRYITFRSVQLRHLEEEHVELYGQGK